MEPIRPISRDLPKLEAIERVEREAERRRDEQQRQEQRKRPRPQRPLEPPEDDGRPHIDVSV
jgi:hypothetical protein